MLLLVLTAMQVYQLRRDPASEVRTPGARADTVVATTEAERVVLEQVQAYRRRDLDAFLQTYSPDLRTYLFPDSLIDTGLATYRQVFSRMFKEQLDMKIEVLGMMSVGNVVFLREHVTGLRNGNSIQTVMVYEVTAGKISAVRVFE